MRGEWIRWQRRIAVLATGGVTLGILEGLSMVNFAYLFTNFLSQFLGALVTLLLGGSLQNAFFGAGYTGLGGLTT